MTIDYTEDAAGRMSAFAAGCTSAYVFVRNMVMRPAIKSCHARINELEQDRERLIRRIETLETVLLTHGTGAIRNAIQGALSELRLESEQKLKGAAV